MKLLEIIRDPEHFILDRYYMSEMPDGFRLEIFFARSFNWVRNNIKRKRETCSKIQSKRLDGIEMDNLSFKEKNGKGVAGGDKKTVFCQFCEKHVVPKRTHKLDFGDIILVFFTGGFWAILLFMLYLFMRRCPDCNLSLRGVKPLESKKTTD